MKPTPQISSNHQSSRGDGQRDHRNFPRIDHAYHSPLSTRERSTSAADEKAYAPQTRAFWKVSADYFSVEATRDYVMEAIFFAWISGVAAWPVAVAIHQLTRWII
jgi:hypothetical protein